VRESLEVDEQVLRCLVNLHFLERGHMVPTLGAVPLVIASESLLLAKSGEAIIDGDIARRSILSPLIGRIEINPIARG
jgi:hypothetical protein